MENLTCDFVSVNQLKNDLCCSMHIDDVKMMFRFLTERFRDSEAILANLTCKRLTLTPACHERRYWLWLRP